jgi:redox-sensing transcriptional repressor
MSKKEVPHIVIKRLPQYLRMLERLAREGIETISSANLATQMDFSAAQIRKDLSHFGGFGKQGRGYKVDALCEQLRHILNVDQSWDVAIIGANCVGEAMARDQNLPERGFRIKMIFDDDDDNIGREIADLTVQDAAEMVKMIRAEDIQIAILAVLAEEAQQVADQLVEAGIRVILNCAPIRLTTPEAIRVEGIDAAARMQEMSYYLD